MASSASSSSSASSASSTLTTLTWSNSLGGGSGRNLIERKEWRKEEDEQIHAAVRKHGFKWRLVAADVPGRSDDAVRNRWHRIKHEHEGPSAEAKPEAKPEAAEPDGSDKGGETSDGSGGGGRPAGGPRVPPRQKDAAERAKDADRISWSRAEDELIMRCISSYGHRWATIAEHLPGRTEHAIRNRYSRLQSLASRGQSIALSSSSQGQPIGIQLVPGH